LQHGGARINSGGPRPNSGGVRINSGGPRINSGGPRENSGGARPNSGPKRILYLPRPDAERWYVVRTVHGGTDLADEQIRAAGFEVVTARICRPATRARRSASGSLIRATEERFDPLFPRYVIVRLNLSDPDWMRVLQPESVETIISGEDWNGDKAGVPISIPDSAIDFLRRILSPTGVYYPKGYRQPFDDDEPIDVGTSLHTKDGLLADYSGTCDHSDGKRVKMLMGWFGRDNVPTHVRQSLVEAT
jgi:transcription antitermination factor NusG